MDVLSIILKVRQSLQTVESFSNQGIEPEEIVLQFNSQYTKYVRDLIDNKLLVFPLQDRDTGYQQNVRDLESLRPLETSKVYNTIAVADNIIELSIDKSSIPDYLTFIKFSCKIQFKCYDNFTHKETDKTQKVKVRIEEFINIENIITDKYAKSNFEELVGSIYNDKCFIYLDKSYPLTVKNCTLSYLKDITPIEYVVDGNGDYSSADSTHFELNDSVAEEIIARTKIALLSDTGDNQKIVNVEKLI